MIGRISGNPQRWQAVERHVWSQFALLGAPDEVSELGGAGGFSGAEFWRIVTPRDTWCLRAWPREGPTVERLRWIHGNLRQSHISGCHVVPLPRSTRNGHTWVAWNGHLWELTPWMAGAAGYWAEPNQEKLVAALSTLARLHISLAPPGGPAERPGVSPSLRSRIELVHELDETLYDALDRATSACCWPALKTRARAVLTRYRATAAPLAPQWATLAARQIPVRICHGDLWHDHVLFREDAVSGFIDFGSMRVDSPVLDVARLLGSFVADDRALWRVGLQAYDAVRPLSEIEHSLLAAFDQSAVLLAGIHWLRWLLLEKRQFDNPNAVLARLDALLSRDTRHWPSERPGGTD